MIQNLIQRLFPMKSIYYHLSDLQKDSSSIVKDPESLCLSFEANCRSRRFCNLNFLELRDLFEKSIELERSLYEVIPLLKTVKLYIDFEYLISFNQHLKDHSIGIKSILKILYAIFYPCDVPGKSSQEIFNAECQKFLVLTA